MGQCGDLDGSIDRARPRGGPLFRFKVFEPDPTSCAQAVPCLFDAAKEPRIMFEPVFEPVLFRLEADQHARRFAMARDDDLLLLRLSKKPRQIVLDFGEWNFLHSGFPRANHDSASWV